jgi:pentatricopeptide repeat protein
MNILQRYDLFILVTFLVACSSAFVPPVLVQSQQHQQYQQQSHQSQEQEQIHILNDLSKQGTKDAANIAYDILKSLESSSPSSSSRHSLNVVHYALVINACANIGDVSSASAILENMIQKCTNAIEEDKRRQRQEKEIKQDQHSTSRIIVPNSHCFSGVMKAYIKEYNNRNRSVKKSKPSSLLRERCEEIIQRMSKLRVTTGNMTVTPNTVVYNLLLKAYTEEASSYMLQKGGGGGRDINSLPKSFHSKRSTSNVGDKQIKGLLDKAIDVLTKMESGYINEDGIKYPEPDSFSYCTVISLLAKCVTDSKTAEIAESYLEKVSLLDTASYNAVILAWSKLGTRSGAERATLLLEKLESSITNHDRKSRGRPNSTTYNTVISAWVKSCSYGDNGFAARKAEEILKRMERHKEFQPNVIAYSSIIDCWSKSGSLDGAKQAQVLLDHMEHLYLSGENKNVKPNVITYTSVLTAYARTNTEEGANRANDLLEHMKELQCPNGDQVKPNLVSYFAVIDSWARSKSVKSGANAESILNKLEKLYAEGDQQMRPDVRVYARVIVAHVKCRNYEAAEKVVNRMERFALSSDETHALAKPNVVIYNTLINEYARQRHSKRAMKILNQMDRYNSMTRIEADKVRADEHTLNGIIYALSVGYGKGKGKARKALKILERLENSHIHGDWDVKPSTRSYNMVINVCANSFREDEEERSEALSISLNVYAKLVASSYADVDRFTFISLLKACGKLLPTKSKRRQKYVTEIFTSCCDEGLVDDDVLGNFLLATSSTKLPDSIATCIEKTKDAKVTSSMLPSEWTFRAKKSVSLRNLR